MPLKIRTLEDGDIDFAGAQTAREGWDNTPASFRLFLEHDPDGCFLAEIDGRSAGMITSTRHVGSAWLGNLIVAPDFRRRGVGEGLMRHTMDHLTQRGVRTLWLEGDPMGVNIYRRLGFVDRFDSPRFHKAPPHDVPPPEAAEGDVETLSGSSLEAIRAYDTPRFGDDRGKLLGELLSLARGAFGVNRNGRLVGYVMALPSGAGVRIGPCVAEDDRALTRLLDAVLATSLDEDVILAVPGDHATASALLEARGFTRTPSSLRMGWGAEPSGGIPGRVAALANGAAG